MEPNASTVDERLDTLEKLHRAAVSCEIRVDPLIPGLTDTADRFEKTMRQASLRGVTHGILSYLFLRRGNMTRLSTQYGDWHFRKIAASMFTQKIENYANSANTIRVPSTEYRQSKYKELQAIGIAYGITLGLCACKNPDITTACCHPLPQPAKRPPPPTSGNLFAQNNA